MVIPGHEPMSPADFVLAEALAQEIRTLLVGRSVVDCVVLLQAINTALAEQQARAAAEPSTVHSMTGGDDDQLTHQEIAERTAGSRRARGPLCRGDERAAPDRRRGAPADRSDER